MTLIVGELHSFEVYVNGELIFSKAEAGRFPEAAEIFAEIERILAALEG